MIESIYHTLPHGIALHCHACGHPGKPLLLFLHGFPEGAFIWDQVMAPFAHHWRCVAPDLRGYGLSSRPTAIDAYKPQALVQDLLALIACESSEQTAACVIAHDWGGALAWNLAIQHPNALTQMMIINAPHPGTFLRELQRNPQQQAASQYMHFLRRPDAAQLLLANQAQRLWDFFRNAEGAWPNWLTPELQMRYLDHWQICLPTACHYYSASPLVPPRDDDHRVLQLQLPDALLSTTVPTQVLWGLEDTALQPALLDGLATWVPHVHITRAPAAGHWLVHERPAWVVDQLQHWLHSRTIETAAQPTA